jgi:hypothetical protein
VTDNLQYVVSRKIGYQAAHITTPVESLLCWNKKTDVRTVVTDARKLDLSYLPVRNNGQFNGVVNVDALERGDNNIIPLTNEWLVSHDTPILHLLSLFALHPDRVFFVLESSEIRGLVTPADLNRVPSRATIYLLLALFESALVDIISREIGNDKSHLQDFLSLERIQKRQEIQETARRKDIDLPLIHYLELTDLAMIVGKSTLLRGIFGFESRTQAEKQLSFSKIRNAVAHPANMLINSRDDLTEINEKCNRLIQLIQDIFTRGKI